MSHTLEMTDEQYDAYLKMLEILRHTMPDQTGGYFICGEGGDKDEWGLPEVIVVCPAMGMSESVVYRKVENNSK